jgi:hypothetical protein
VARRVRGFGAQARLSFWIFGIGDEGLIGATDSAVNSHIGSGVFRPSLGLKVNRLPQVNVSIAVCGALELPLAYGMTHEWPLPSSLVGRTPTFKEVVVAVRDQMQANEEVTAEANYSLALFSGPGSSFPRLATIHDGSIQDAAVGDILYASYARSAQDSWFPERAPNNLVALRDLVIAASSRTLRAFGGHTVDGHPVISWPIYLYTRPWIGGSTIRSAMETIEVSAGVPDEWRHFGNSQMDICAPVFRAQFLEVVEGLAAKGWHPEDLTVSLKLTGDVKPASPANRPAVAGATEASTLSPEPATETPAETPPDATLPPDALTTPSRRPLRGP